MNTCLYLMFACLVPIIMGDYDSTTSTILSELTNRPSMPQHFAPPRKSAMKSPQMSRQNSQRDDSDSDDEDLTKPSSFRKSKSVNFSSSVKNPKKMSRLNSLKGSTFKWGRDIFNRSFNLSLLFGSLSSKYWSEHVEKRSDIPIVLGDDTLDEDDESYLVFEANRIDYKIGDPRIPITSEHEFIMNSDVSLSFPYHVVITKSFDDDKNWCQGALIKRNWIITSGHCLKTYFDLDSNTSVEVVLDAMDTDTSDHLYYTDVVLKDNIIFDPLSEGSEKFGLGDVALVKLESVPTFREIPAEPAIIIDDIIVTKEQTFCFYVTRCSDGVVRAHLFDRTGKTIMDDAKFIKVGTIIVCDKDDKPKLINIKMENGWFLPLYGISSWVKNEMKKVENKPPKIDPEEIINAIMRR